MNLVFKEYINFLKNNGLNYELKEGFYWYDKSIIKAYDKEGNLHKILRINISDNLKLSFKFYKDSDFELESWKETVERNKNILLEKEKESIETIKKYINKYNDRKVAVPSSGGKDSSVTTYLVKQVVEDPEIIFNNTTLDVADTYLHIKKENNLTIINPKEGFYQWRDRLNFIPTRFARSCCTIFKEGAMVDYLSKDSKYLFFMGMRNDESNTRSGYGDEWINTKWQGREWSATLPIRKWKEEEIWLYILLRGIDINNKYKKGYGRVGCACACPYYSKSTWALDKYWYTKLYNRWHNILEEDFIKNKKATIMNCSLSEYHLKWNGGIVRNEATEGIINEFAQQQGLEIEIARKYFNKTCKCCGKKLKKDDVALSMKLYGRHINNFKCVKCISEEFNKPVKELKERIKDFKENGCKLF